MFTRYEPLGVYVKKYPMSASLVFLCIAVFLFDLLPLSVKLYEWGAFYAPFVAEGEWHRLVSALFLHGDWMHLGMNALFIYVFGPYAEQRLGRIRYTLFYFLAGIGSFSLVYLLSNGVTIGASGAIYGLLAFYMHLFWKEPFQFSNGDKQTVWMLVTIGFVFSFLMPNVSVAGHAGGFFFGFILSPVFFRK